jgi:hypothetical protein
MLKNINPDVKKLALVVTVRFIVPLAVCAAALVIEKKFIKD